MTDDDGDYRLNVETLNKFVEHMRYPLGRHHTPPTPYLEPLDPNRPMDVNLD